MANLRTNNNVPATAPSIAPASVPSSTFNTELRAQARREREATRERSREKLVHHHSQSVNHPVSGSAMPGSSRERSASATSALQHHSEKKISPKLGTKKSGDSNRTNNNLSNPPSSTRSSTNAGSSKHVKRSSSSISDVHTMAHHQPIQAKPSSPMQKLNSPLLEQDEASSNASSTMPTASSTYSEGRSNHLEDIIARVPSPPKMDEAQVCRCNHSTLFVLTHFR